MIIVTAPDSFKGSLSATEVAGAIEKGLKSVKPDVKVVKVPMADGGDGTARTLVDAAGGRMVPVEVLGPLGDRITAEFGLLRDGTAVVEMASASGLALVPPARRNPMDTTTYGTGQLIKAALDCGAQRIIIGLGGSATVDGGMGMAQALGYRFIVDDGSAAGFGGKFLNLIDRIELSGVDPRIHRTKFRAACDVDNPLCGPNGAAHVFGPQKGADDRMVEELDTGLANLARVIKKEMSINVEHIPGAGAAGGLGAGIVAFLGAELRRGIDIVIDAVKLEQKLKGAVLVITGEGRMDFQSIRGKTPCGVAAAAKKYGIPVAAIVGGVGEGADIVYDHGIDAIEPITDRPMALEECMAESAALVERAAARLLRKLLVNLK